FDSGTILIRDHGPFQDQSHAVRGRSRLALRTSSIWPPMSALEVPGKADIVGTRTRPSGCDRLFDPQTRLGALFVLVAGGAAHTDAAGDLAVDHDRQSAG